jgi:hypothetical protein
MGDFTVNVRQKPMDFNRWQLGLLLEIPAASQEEPAEPKAPTSHQALPRPLEKILFRNLIDTEYNYSFALFTDLTMG